MYIWELYTTSERVILIDRLLHAFHWELHQHVGMSRPVAVDLIAGRFEEVVEFLDTLTYGEHTPPDIQREHASWDQKVERSGEWYRQALAISRSSRRDRLSGD